MFFLIWLTFQIQVSNEFLKEPKVDILRGQEFIDFVEKHPKVIVFRTSSYNSEFYQPFIEIKGLLDVDIPFIVLNDDVMPSIELFENGECVSSVCPITDQVSMMAAITVYSSYKPETISNKEDFIIGLEGINSFLITTEDNFNAATEILTSTNHTSTFGLKLVTQDFLNQLEINSSFCVYRSLDQAIEPFNGTAADYQRAIIPLITKFKSFKEMKNGKLIFALLHENLNANHTKFLYDIATQYPDLIVTYTTKEMLSDFCAFVRRYPPYDFDSRIILCNPSEGYFYDPEDMMPEQLKVNRFETELFEEFAFKFINDSISGNYNKSYVSEFEPRNLIGTINKLVGTNYHSFLSEFPTCVILFANNSRYSRSIFDSYVDLTTELNATAKFAFINVEMNMVEGGYPVTPSEAPKVAIYKDGNYLLMEEELTYENMRNFVLVNFENKNVKEENEKNTDL